MRTFLFNLCTVTIKKEFLKFEDKKICFSKDKLTSDVVDGLLVFLHAGQVLCEGGGLISRLRTVVAQQLRQLLAVLRILMDAQLQTDNCDYVSLIIIRYTNSLDHNNYPVTF